MSAVTDLDEYRERRRLLTELAEVGRLALDALALGDRDLLADCERWHHDREQKLEAMRCTR